MLCRCPACQHLTEFQPEQLDFLVRCDKCRALFIARSPESVEFARKLAAQLQRDSSPDKILAADPAPIESTEKTEDDVLAEVVQLVEEEHRLQVTRARLAPSPRQKQLQRFELRWRRCALGIISLCGLIALILLSALVVVLHTLRVANAATSTVSHSTSAEAPGKPARKIIPAAAEPTGTGELFPEVKSQ